MLLLVTSSLLAAAAVAIKLETPGPVLFRQARVGRAGRPFEMLKLRTFQHGAPPEGTWVLIDERTDPRITRWAGGCARPRWTRSLTWSTWCAARWRWSAHARAPLRVTPVRWR